MMNRFAWILALMALMAFSLRAQSKMTVEEYIEQYKDIAMDEMKKHHIPASIKLAQGILESSSGNSNLAIHAKNHFGIKCHKGWTGPTYHQDDDEKDECFRKYGSAEDSYRDHSQFLMTRDRYKGLFELEVTDYKGWAKGLKDAGYATNPRYPELLIRIIEENELYLFDTGKGIKKHKDEKNIEPGSPNPGTLEPATPENFPGPPSVFDIAGRAGNDRVVFVNNGAKFILAREGDDFYRVAEEFGIYGWQIRSYNELKKTDALIPGEKVYLEKKGSKAAVARHQVAGGEDLRMISQAYGIRMKALVRRNGIDRSAKLQEGDIIRLN
jgi:hypothetical protein